MQEPKSRWGKWKKWEGKKQENKHHNLTAHIYYKTSLWNGSEITDIKLLFSAMCNVINYFP